MEQLEIVKGDLIDMIVQENSATPTDPGEAAAGLIARGWVMVDQYEHAGAKVQVWRRGNAHSR